MPQRIKSALKRGFLFLLIPGLGIYVGWSVVSLLDNFWTPFFSLFLGKLPFWSAGFLLTLILILLIGLVLTSKFIQTPKIAALMYAILSRIPLLNFFFGKEFFSKHDLEKTKAALVEYPAPGCWSVGFLTGIQHMENGENCYKVFVPTAPIPATGLFVMIKVSDSHKIIPLKNPPLEVMKLIISCGLTTVELEQKHPSQNTPH